MKIKLITILFLLFSIFLSHSQTVEIIAGIGTSGYLGDDDLAINAQLNFPNDVDVDSYGNVYITDRDNHRIRKVDVNGVITTVAGTGIAGYSGDGSFAVNAKINFPLGIKIDNENNIYFVDNNNHCIRKINTNGIISTVAGTGLSGYTGDGSLATNAKLNLPQDLAIDTNNNLYITDSYNNRIRKVDPNGIITTIAGTGSSWYNVSGDGGQAINAEISYVTNIYIDQNNNIYFTDWQNHLIRKINSDGIISTIAGIGISGYTGDNGLAIGAKLNHPTGLTIINGNLYFADRDNYRIRKIDTNGIITTYAGGNYGCSTMNGLLSDFQFDLIAGLNEKNGDLYAVNQGYCNTIIKIVDSSLATVDKIFNEVSFFPNPSKDLINFSNIEGLNKIEIYDMKGNLVFIEDKVENNQTSVEKLNKGVYYLKLITNNGHKYIRVLKE